VKRVTIYELRVGDGDLGKVIGRSGQTAKAIRKILSAAAAKTGKTGRFRDFGIDGCSNWGNS
jgi:predicted RNA-binding protein YlqC (UPF0109 family)